MPTPRRTWLISKEVAGNVGREEAEGLARLSAEVGDISVFTRLAEEMREGAPLDAMKTPHGLAQGGCRAWDVPPTDALGRHSAKQKATKKGPPRT